MAQIFPEWTNKVPSIAGAGVLLLGCAAVLAFWYYGSPKNTDVGYRPVQPIAYSHKLHAGDLGLDCRYCHTSVEASSIAIIPPTQTCMNCHKLVLPESEKLLPVRESYSTEKPMEWIRVHNIPDYAYFNHSAHINAGVGCQSCHGNIDYMEIVMQTKPLSMGWCLECHRNPDMHLRPLDQATNMRWAPPDDQPSLAVRIKRERTIEPSVDCSGCHR